MMKNFTLFLTLISFNLFAQSQGGNELLTINPTALPEAVCKGEAVQLFSYISAMNSTYTIMWSSDPPGFTSDQPNPVVTPDKTTTYKLTVNDGINSFYGNVTVLVKRTPEIKMIQESDPSIRVINHNTIGTCVFNSVTLDAGNPGSIYLWTNGSTTQKVVAQTSGIGYDEQYFGVLVTDPLTGCSKSDEMTIQFNFTDCTYGISENDLDSQIKIYPNPSEGGIFNIVTKNLNGDVDLQVVNSSGLIVYKSIQYKALTENLKSTLDLSNLSAGIYILQIKDNNTLYSRKLVIR